MKKPGTAIVRIVLVAAALTISAGSVQAACMAEYHRVLDVCDTFGGWSEVACNATATQDYIDCVATAATT